MNSLKKLCALHNIVAKKSLGQNFLFDFDILTKIASCLNDTKQTVLEIGPGPGGLTRALLARDIQSLYAVELDKRFQPLLQPLQEDPRLHLLWQDALELDFPSLGSFSVVANIPYHITTPLLLKLIKNIANLREVFLLVQKELALRIIANNKNSNYGRLSVISQWAFSSQIMFNLEPEVFYPPPKVTSCLLRLIPNPTIDLTILPFLEKVTHAAFSGRRKMLRQSLKTLFSKEKLLELNIEPSLRAENLTIEEYIKLANCLGTCL